MLVVRATESVGVGLFLSLPSRFFLIKFELLHLLIQRPIKLMIIQLNFLLELIDPFLANIWYQFPRLSASAPAISPKVTQVNSLQASLSAFRLKLLLEQLQLRLEVRVVDVLFFVAYNGMGSMLLRTLFSCHRLRLRQGLILHLIKYFYIRRYFLLPILNL